MVYELPSNNLYGNQTVQLSFPESWNVRVCSFAGEIASPMTQDQMSAKLRHPAFVRPISEAARGARSAVIIFDDISRPTPVGEIAEVVLKELLEVGVPESNIWFLAATGMHRSMGREDYVRKLGERIVRRYRIYSHNPFFNCVYAGTTSCGIPIHVNAEILRADYRIAIGSITPHSTVGIGGGPKIILPGICSAETIRQFHRLPKKRWDLDAPGRKAAGEAAAFVGLQMKVDALLNGHGEIADLIVGDVCRAAEYAYPTIRAFYSTPYGGRADIILANNYFKPSEAKLAISSNGIPESVREGGALIVAANSPQGAAPHYLFGQWGETNEDFDALDGGLSPHIAQYYAFSTYPDLGAGIAWHPADRRFRWVSDWETLLSTLGSGEKDVVIYPYASAAYFEPDGIIPVVS